MEKKVKEQLRKLLEMSKEQFTEMEERWKDLEKDSLFSVRKSKDFQLGYVYGKIEHKFISWFYSEYGRSQTDEEYEEFFNTVKEHASKEF
ncbi:MAG TPA: hypothetical protein VH562_01355 [Nitrosopumilaceae archaeon]|jgi:hypothetical protein